MVKSTAQVFTPKGENKNAVTRDGGWSGLFDVSPKKQQQYKPALSKFILIAYDIGL